MTEIPNVKLNNGLEMPVFGLGTWQDKPGLENEVGQAVRDSIDMGYRLFDCSHVCGNQKAIGQAIQDKIREGVVEREDLFIVSKLWCNSHRPDLVEPALKTTLQDLQLNDIDMYLIHWPQAFDEDEEFHSAGPHRYSDVDYSQTWKAMEKVYRNGLAKAIGVSNFNSHQLSRILNMCTVFPQVNQVECHPYLNQNKLRKFCDNHGIVLMVYSPLGGPKGTGSEHCNVIEDLTIKEIAKRYQKTLAQVLVRYSLQLGNIAIPKSFNKNRLLENINVFDFYLAPEDMSLINSLDCNRRLCRFDDVKDHRHYPFHSNVEF